MADNHSDDHSDDVANLVKEEFDLPVTGAFIAGVHRGVRRRRVLRVVAAGGAVAAAAGVVAFVVTLTGATQQSSPAHSTIGSRPAAVTPTPAASRAATPPATTPTAATPTGATSTADPIHRPLAGYRVTVVPDGLRIGGPEDGSATYAVSKDRLHNDGRPAPTSKHPTATATLRTYVRPNGGNWLWISVLRPERTTAEAGRAQVTDWLIGWSIKGTEVMERYDLPAGRAQLTRTVGAEVTTYQVVITAPSGVVISVGANAAVPVADIKAVAAGLRPS